MTQREKINSYEIIQSDSIKYLSEKIFSEKVNLTFLDPPFNQNKEYNYFNDNLPPDEYWSMMKDVCEGVYKNTSTGGAIYFMQREKNTEFVLRCLRET